jgi:O-acetyl-ADP-ribose deacetylase (regulator of RNase III)
MTSMSDRIVVVTGDITQLSVDAIVNAANSSLLGGSGVDGAIHRAAGPRLLAHNKTLGGCPTGAAKITPAFDLERQGVRFIIHTVGPVWHEDEAAHAEEAPLFEHEEDTELASCYAESLKLAEEHGIETIAFPAISTGVYAFPKQRAALIAIAEVRRFIAEHLLPQQVTFCCFSEADAVIYRRELA